MLTILFSKNGTPIYEQIYEYVKDRIISGSMGCGEKLPSKRKLAAHLCVSVNTVDAAYGQLVAEGYIEPVAKKGYFVSQIDEYRHMAAKTSTPESANRPESKITINFSPGDVDYTIFPFEVFRKIFKKIFCAENPGILARTESQGDPGLRNALADLMKQSRGVSCHADQIVIGSGTDSLLQTLGILFGRDKRIVFENPAYLKAYKIFENMGHQVLPVDIDDKGIIHRDLEKYPGAAVYVTPSHHFPLGFSMPIDRRIKLLNYANKNDGSYIIEDDYDSELRYNEKPLPPLASVDKSGKVIYIGTLTKSIAPSIRLSYMVLPETLLKVYLNEFSYAASPVSGFEQKMIAEFINSGGFERHINKMRKVYKDKRKLLLTEFQCMGDAVTIMGENAGHHLLVKLKTGLSEERMCHSALELGVGVYPISPYFIGGVSKKYESTVLLGYGALSFDRITEGVRLLSKAWGIS